MPATVTICEVNGPSPGQTTQGITNLNWGSVDQPNLILAHYNTAINLGSNSYTKYNYLVFSGAFTSLGNVTVTHLTGVLPSGIKLMSSPTMVNDSNKLVYSKPTTANLISVSNNLSTVGSSINLFISPPQSGYDPAYAPNKMAIYYNVGGLLYTNYLVTQIQTSYSGSTGNIPPIVLQITYDEA